MLLPFDRPRSAFERPSRDPILVDHLKVRESPHLMARSATLHKGIGEGPGLI